MITDDQKTTILNAINAASTRWKTAFNSGDAAGCAAQYEEDAVMHARPFGTFTGTTEIQAFWQKLIDDGFSQVEYIDPHIEVVDENSAILASGWKMNKAGGVIHKELWVLQADGTAKLREDDFEAKG
ncbi:nuclear transport factor 2 family protein [Rubellicoccus peritrichatus]|uniref:Nuclear transport factor 2 family protein n=1 Tax=Rubellicoccus peritrichatus TaxID=3080537 RepID=A0AAQ3LAZ3_9BACT|nr:nuclear transport factor 2 family protein [Puniceicoccus sp. CR14]WOO41937.1 nuclear transport factor 2 family protein [Puniceicoccus sp. CR14]